MNFKIEVSQKAFNLINEAVSFVNNVSHEAALSLYKEIMESIRSLETMPRRCPVVKFLSSAAVEIRKMNVNDGRYSLLYSIKEDVVFINSFIDLRQKEHMDIFKP